MGCDAQLASWEIVCEECPVKLSWGNFLGRMFGVDLGEFSYDIFSGGNDRGNIRGKLSEGEMSRFPCKNASFYV